MRLIRSGPSFGMEDGGRLFFRSHYRTTSESTQASVGIPQSRLDARSWTSSLITGSGPAVVLTMCGTLEVGHFQLQDGHGLVDNKGSSCVSKLSELCDSA